MSNYNTDLKTNNTNLQNILDTINNLPEAGSGSGGASIETCNLQISTSDGWFTTCYYTILDNGYIYSDKIDAYVTNATTLSIDNIICGSCVDIGTSSGMLVCEELIGAEVIGSNNKILRITAGAGETAIIKYYNPF